MFLLPAVLRKGLNKDVLSLAFLLPLAFWRIFSFPLWLVESRRGLPRSPDGDWYLNYALSLLEDFSLSLHINDILYLSYNMLLTTLLALFKDPVAVIYTQAGVASLAVALVYLIARMLFNCRTGFIAGLFYIYNWEVTFWATYLLSDSFFVSLVILCVYLLVKAADSQQAIDKIAFGFMALYMALFRPSGILVLTVMLAYLFSRLDKRNLRAVCERYRNLLTGVAAAFVLGTIFLYCQGTLDELIASFRFNASMVLYNVYARGRIYDIATAFDYVFQPNYALDIWDSCFLSFFYHNWDSVLILYFRRAVAFFGRWTWEMNFHQAVDYRIILPKLLPPLLFAAGTIEAIRCRTFARAAILWWIVLAIFVFCIVLFIDAMYRYRFPAMPFIGIVAAYGADRLIQGGFCLANRFKFRWS